jgi:hypothetical protein
MGRGKIAIGFTRGRNVSGLFLDSLISALAYDQRNGRLINHRVISVTSGPNIDRARNVICQTFLDHPDRPDWLLMVDTDMVFDPDTPYRLLNSAGPKDRPVVGALCHALDEDDKPYPAIYTINPDTGAQVITNYSDGICKVDATGAAFLLIHRDVLIRLKLKSPSYAPWFAYSYFPNGQFISEDWTFCLRCNASNIPIFVDTRIRVGHEKGLVI